MRHYNDSLEIVNSKQPCPKCNGEKPQVKECVYCKHSGFESINLSGLWHRDNPTAGFLVCGGPSINQLPYHKLKERGVVSLGINNVAAHVPVSVWCFSDPHTKFHHALFFDPAIMTFAPTPKLNKRIRIKQADGTFRELNKKVKDYCAFHNINFEESKYNGVMMFYIGGVDVQDADVWDELNQKTPF
jgi:hypothetical protein